MMASYQFLGAVGFLFVAAFVFSAMQRGAGFGTAADWAAAGANVAVVIVSLYLAGKQRRREDEREQARVNRARVGLRSSIKSLVEVTERMLPWLDREAAWPEAVIRRDFTLMLETVELEWLDVENQMLPARDRVIGRGAAPKVSGLLFRMKNVAQANGLDGDARTEARDLALDDVLSLTGDLDSLGLVD